MSMNHFHGRAYNIYTNVNIYLNLQSTLIWLTKIKQIKHMMCNVHDPSLGRGGVHIAPPPLPLPPPQFVSNCIIVTRGWQAPGRGCAVSLN